MPASPKLLIAAAIAVLVSSAASASPASACQKVDPMTAEQIRNADNFNAIGVDLSSRGDRERAAEIFLEATRRYPGYAISWNNAGIGLGIFFGRYEESLPYFRRAICIDPNFAMAHFFFGTALYELKEYDASEAALKRAIQLQPDYLQAKNNLASVYLRMGRYKDARRILEELVARSPGDFIALNNLAAAHFYENDLNKAEATFAKLAELFPERHIAQFNLAVVYLYRGKRAEAIRIQRNLLERDAELAETLYLGIFGDKILSFRQP